MKRKSLTYFRAVICAFGLVLAGSPPGTVFAEENDTKQEASAGSGGSVYRAESAKDMAEHVSAMENDNSDRLIVSETADLSGFLDKGTAVYYGGTYIISFENSKDQESAYQTLQEEFGEDAVFHDARLSVCGNETEDKEEQPQETDQSDTEAVPDDEVVQEDEKAVPEEASESDEMPLVAMIDTGCNDENVYQSLNITSEDPDDLNGHGTQMYQYMLDAAGETNFRLLSVKAFGEDGTASVSDIITAIKYAEEEGADVICLSASARDSNDFHVLKTEIMNAIAYGIEVIVPAGNDGEDAMNYVPSDVDGAVVIGAASEDGSPLSISNTGDCVSCYVTAESTSEAAAKYTGYLIAGKLDSEDIHYQDGNDTADRNGIATYATTAGSSSGIYAVYCSANTTLYILQDATTNRAIGSSITFRDASRVTRQGVITQNDFLTCKGTSAKSYCIAKDKETTEAITAVVNLLGTSQKVQPVSTAYWFAGFINARTIDVSWIDTSRVTDMTGMFLSCSSVTSLNVASFNTSNVTNMTQVFAQCSSLRTLEAPKWNTSKVTTIYGIFGRCTALKSVNIADWDMSKVTRMDSIFLQCENLTSLDLSKWNTSNVTSFQTAFFSCSSLNILDISGWDTSTAKIGLQSAFGGCKLFQISLGAKTSLPSNCGLSAPTSSGHATYTGNWVKRGTTETVSTSELISKSQSSAAGTWVAEGASVAHAVYCSSNKTFYLVRLNGIYTIGSSVSFKDKNGTTRTGVVTQNDLESENGASGRQTTTSASGGTGSTFQPSYLVGTVPVASVTAIVCTDPVYPITTQNWFYRCSNVTSIDLSGLDTKNTSNMQNMLSDCKSLRSLTLGTNTVLKSSCGLYTPSDGNLSGKWKLTGSSSQSALTSSELISKSSSGAAGTWTAEELVSCAAYCADNTTLYLTKVSDTYQVGDSVTITDKGGTARNCEITDIRLENASFSYTTSIADAYKSRITSVICLNAITPRGTRGMEYWFHDFSNVTSFDLSLLDTSQVTDVFFAFAGCSSLESIDLSTFDFGKVDLFNSMFRYCSSLASIDMSGLDTKSATDMSSMFASCSSLATVNMSGLNTQKVTTFSSLFSGCSGLTSVNLSGLNTENIADTKGMFRGCSKLTAIDISDFNTEKVTNMTNMFKDCLSLNRLTLGEKTILLDNCMLPSPEGNKAYTGKWTVSDPYNHVDALSAADLIAKTQTGGTANTWMPEMMVINAKLQLTQYDAGTNKLGGAEYVLYKEDGTAVNFTSAGTNKIVINQNGQSDVLDSTLFVTGKYYLLQTKTPDGYAAAPQINFEIKDSDAGQTVQIEVHNNKLVVLPSTGGMGRDEIYLIAALLFIAAGMMTLLRKKINA